MEIAVVQDWSVDISEYFDYDDGVRKAIEVIGNKHKVTWYTSFTTPLTLNYKTYKLEMVSSEATLVEKLTSQKPDVIIAWGSLDRPWHKLIHESFKDTPKVLLFAGGPRNHIAKSYFNVIVCESQCYIEDFTRVGVTAVRGFGTNIDVFRPRRLPKVWDAIYPASLCFHKNLELFARSFGGRGLCVGNHNEPTIASKILSLGCNLMHRVNADALADLYNMARVTVVTCGPEGGAQRVVLESMACGTPVVVMNDHDRCVEFVEESKFGKVCHPVDIDIREAVTTLLQSPPSESTGVAYIQSKWTQDHYADSILDACKKAMGN